MKIKMLTTLLLTFICQGLLAQVSVVGIDNKTFGSGDLVKAQVTLLDNDLINELNLVKLSGVPLAGKVIIFSSTPFVKSQNEQNLVSDVQLIFTQEYKGEPDFVLKSGERDIKFTLKGFNFDPKANQAKGELDYFKTELDFSKAKTWFFLIFILILPFLIYFSIKFYIKFNNKKKLKNLWKKYFEQLSSAKSRSEFESIWIQRDLIKKKWQKVLPAFNIFWEVLLKVQFKEKWSEEDFKLVRMAYQKLIDELKNYDGI